MSESTLTEAYNSLAGEVGFFLGFGRGAALGDPAWDSHQQAAIDSCVKSGLRKFYFPSPIEGQESSYDWSFLKPMATLTLAAALTTLPLPDDYGGVDGQMVVSASSAIAWMPLNFGGVGQVYAMAKQSPTTTGRPQLACTEPLKGTTGQASNRSQLRIWPIPDQAYTLQFRYYVNPDYLSGAFPYAYGGAPHAETMKAAVVAAAELYLDDAKGPRDMEFKERLLASINMDRRNKPLFLGYNGDRSDLRDRQWNSRYGRFWGDVSPITVSGVQY